MKKTTLIPMLSLMVLGTAASFVPTFAATPTEAQLKSMLDKAILDEYNARAEYEALVEEFGSVRPFVNLIQAETSHIRALTNLYTTYGFTVPVDNGALSASVPSTLEEAYQIGVDAETANIAIYAQDLKLDLPADVERVFTNLMKASENHLAAFDQALDGNLPADGTCLVPNNGPQTMTNRMNANPQATTNRVNSNQPLDPNHTVNSTPKAYGPRR